MARRDDNREVIVVERDGGAGSLWWLMLGGAVGAGLALLFAPQSGARTRRQLAKRLAKLRDSAEDAYEELREAIDPDEEGVHRSLSETEEEAKGDEESEEPAPRRGGTPARLELEKRLAAARARHQRALADVDEEPVA